ncbi:MAG: hypothetical protein AB7Q00_11490 [Phycisphaerales bacterium]
MRATNEESMMGFKNPGVNSRRARRPYVRARAAGSPAMNGTARLASLAGGLDRPSVDQLEKRQLLFSLTITPADIDPATGIGTVRQAFAYVLPSLIPPAAIEQQQQQTEDRTEDFNDDNPGAAGSGTFFTDSGIQILHNVVPAGSIRIEPPGADNTERYLRGSLANAGDFISFKVFDDPDNPTGPAGATRVQFTVTGDGGLDNTGLDTARMRITLRRANVVIATFTGPQIDALIQNAQGPVANGVGNFVIDGPVDDPSFDEVRIETLTAPGAGINPAFRVDDLAFTIPTPQFAGFIDGRVFGALAVLSGPVGATVTITDLLGADVAASLAGHIRPNGTLALADLNDDGIPDAGFNGIGAIRFTGTDSRTAFSLVGGVIEESDTPVADADQSEGTSFFTITADLAGFADEFEDAGFGFYRDPQGQGNFVVHGLPPVAGSVMVGSPFVNTSGSNPRAIAPGANGEGGGNFTNPTQGIFVDGGMPMGSVLIHGTVFGSSVYTGAVDRIAVVNQYGSIRVNGDLGSLIVGGEAGTVSPDEGTQGGRDGVLKTNGQLVVGRTLGQFIVAGRSDLDVTVTGDLNSPLTIPARDTFTYYESEFVLGINPNTDPINVMRQLVNNTNFTARQPSDLFRAVDQPIPFGAGFLRNDSLISAEFVGSVSTGVRIIGDISGQSPFDAEDKSDVYSFAVDGTQDIVIEAIGDGVGYIRIMDAQGHRLAAPEDVTGAGTPFAGQFRFRPDGPGVYYLVVTDGNFGEPDNNFGNASYSIALTGLSPVAAGLIRTGGSMGRGAASNVLNVPTGSIGVMRVGTGVFDGDADATIESFVNNYDGLAIDELMSWHGGTYTLGGTLFSLIAGSDIGGAAQLTSAITLNVGGNVGQMYTGLHPVVGGGPAEGDLNSFNLRVGGSIGYVNISGGVGMNQDAQDPLAPADPDTITFVTGTSGGRGDIGYIRTGFHVAGDTWNIQTSPGSTIGAFLVSQDSYGPTTDQDRWGIYGGTLGLPITSGFGSDVRFFDTPKVDLDAGPQTSFLLQPNQSIEFVDDAGARVQITIEGGLQQNPAAVITVLPIDGSQGVTIASIIADLTGGAILRVTGVSAGGGASPGSVGIGRIIIANHDFNSAVEISGNVEIDVYRTEINAGGATFAHIGNSTPGGDMVTIDADTLNALDITRGSLGSTQMPAWGPRRIGVELGVVDGLQGGVGGPLGVNTDSIVTNYNGNIYRPLDDDSIATGNAYLEDLGVPFDEFLNGLVVRNGGIAAINVARSVGDVILQTAPSDVPGTTARDGEIASINANSDGVTPFGAFDGVVGSIYAGDISQINIGDGLRNTVDSPFASAGIFAIDDIGRIYSSRPSGVILSGPIVASNANDPQVDGETQGIGRIEISNGSIIDADINAAGIDTWWQSYLFTQPALPTGDINEVIGTNTNFYRSNMRGRTLNNFSLNNGYYDASTTRIFGRIRNISFLGTRNSTLEGPILKVRDNLISTPENLENLTIAQNMNDLTINVVGSVTGRIQARNISRSIVGVANTLQNVQVAERIKSSSFVLGRLPTLNAGISVESSEFIVSGPIQNFTTGERIANTRIEVSGPDGRIDSITTRDLFSGSVAVSGPITSICVTQGDLEAAIDTTGTFGNVTRLTAGRDLKISGTISGNVSELTAGRHIGDLENRSAIVVRGDLSTATASTGRLYADLRVGGTIGTVSMNSSSSKIGKAEAGEGSIIAFGAINNVAIRGDFGGDIISYSGGINSVTITDGSFLPGRTIAAYSASIASLVITNGNLYGNVHADVNITLLRVAAGADGVFGDIGINPNLSQFAAYDALRNQLPPGIAISSDVQGPTISAGEKIVNLSVTGGSVFEATFFAGRSIDAIAINGSVANDFATPGVGTVFAAGDTITNISITGSVANAAFVAGVVNFGSDNRLGGVGSAADLIKSGDIATVSISGSASNTSFSAGILAGADGVYNTVDDRVAPGLSFINAINIAGTATNVTAYGDTISSAVANNAKLSVAAAGIATSDPAIDSGIGIPGTQFSGTQTFNIGGGTVTLTFSGPGQAFFDSNILKVTLRSTTTASSLTVSSTLASLTNFDIVSNDDASLGTLTVNPGLAGGSDVVIDGNVNNARFTSVATTGRISIGGNVNAFTFDDLTAAQISARTIQTLTVNGAFGNVNPAVVNDVNVFALSAGTIALRNGARGAISIDRDATAINITGTAERSTFRVGGSLGSFTSGEVRTTVVSVGKSLTTATVNGSFFDSAILGGVDLGTDGFYGGAGLAADRAGAGSIGNVTINGNFQESDIIAGFLRGPDGFFGTADDSVAGGLSTIGSVNISGNQVGSTRLGESYRIASSGTLGTVRLAGQNVTNPIGNFATDAQKGKLAPADLQVTDIVWGTSGTTFTATLQFNQPVNASTISSALSVLEVRGNGAQTIRLIESIDFNVSYNNTTNAAVITFSRDVTSANLPSVPGIPGPGVYRFELDREILRGRSLAARVDGNGDGVSLTGDNYRGHGIVGDAGDRAQAEVFNTALGRVDLYAPISLDLLLDNPSDPDGLPEVNTPITIRGFIGDNPDHNPLFSTSADTDAYTITLIEGQILRISPLTGSANLANFLVLDPDGVAVTPADAVDLPVGTETRALLVKRTGLYTIVVTNLDALPGQGDLQTLDPIPGGVGDYSFTIDVFDDHNTGFTSTTDSADGQSIATAPGSTLFAGPDGNFGTADDLGSIVVGDTTFTVAAGADAILGTADDVVTGTNGHGITTSSSGGSQSTVINSSIGPAGRAGVPNLPVADVDVYHLNNRDPIVPGTRMRITLRLARTGADLGFLTSGEVQFGLFDTSASSSIDDAVMVFSPSDFSPIAADGPRTIASSSSTTYGYDASGDFFIDFIVPERFDTPGQAGTFALYIQGVNNTDYTVEIVTQGQGQITRGTQNFLIETNGGTINWLEPAGLATSLIPFSASTLGFNGVVVGTQSADDYIRQQLVASLNALFQGALGQNAGFDANFSTNAADFEFQPFSTIFLTSSSDPMTLIFEGPSLTQPFGFSEHSDPFNADPEDEAVIFAPSFGSLGLTPSQADLDNFVQALTAATARRAGELLGLRITSDNGVGGTFDPFAADSVANRPGAGQAYTVPTNTRDLSDRFDTITNTSFYLGRQDSVSLLDRVLGQI